MILAADSFEVGPDASYVALVLVWFGLSALVGLVAMRSSGRAGWFTIYVVLSLVLSPLVGGIACLAEIAATRRRAA